MTEKVQERRARRAVLAIAAAKLAIHLVYSGGYGYFRDEFYYLACGERLAFGYVDHPPAIAVIAKVTRTVLGESPVALRLPAALAGAATIVIAASIARALGGRLFAQVLAATCVLVAPHYLGTDGVLSMNAFEPLTWGAVALLVVRTVEDDAPRRLLWLGPVVGVGLLDKHSMSWVVAAIVLGLLLTPQRRLLRHREVWIAAAIAALIAAPNVIWEARHGWPTLEFARNAQEHKNAILTPLAFLRSVFEGLHPFTAPVWIAGLYALTFGARLRRHRALGLAFFAILALLLFQRGKPGYLMPIFPWLFAAGGVALERVIAAGWARAAVTTTLIAGGCATAPFVLAVLPIDAYQRYASALGVPGGSSEERHEAGPLPQHYADRFGWPELSAAVARAVETLSPDERAVAAIFANNYGEASSIEFFGRALGLPRVICGHNAWFTWGPGSPPPQIIVAVGPDRQDLEAAFEDVRAGAEFDHPLSMPYERHLTIWVCRRPRAPLDQVWPQVKHYD